MDRRPPLPRPRRPRPLPHHPHPRQHQYRHGGNHEHRHPSAQRITTTKGSRGQLRNTTPRDLTLPGPFTYRVTPVFMDGAGALSYGEAQEAALELRRETYPGEVNVAFTRGFVSPQAFVERYGAAAIPTLLPASAKEGLDFVPTYPQADEALAWMGFEARTAILDVLDQA